MKLLLVLFASICVAHGLIRIPTDKELSAFLRSVPRFPTRSVPILPPSPLPSFHAEFNRTFRPVFKPYEGCSLNKSMDLWDYGTIQTPNYPEDYPSDTSCEWILEGPPGSRIQATVFDLETQAWFLGYYDFVAFSRDGNFEKVDQFAGDANSKTPFTVESYENKLGVRFKSNGFINYRGMKMSYVVRPIEETSDNGYQVSNDDGVCGRSFILDETTEPSVETTTVVVEETTTVVAEETTAAPGEETTVGGGEEVTTSAPEATSDSRIIGDTPAQPNAYPWMVAMLINGRSFCGGTIIDDQHVMTAAHCTDGAETITILMGAHNLRASKEEEPNRRIVNVTAENIHQHPNYNEETVTHDISIIRLDDKLEFNDAIRPVCLPSRTFLDQFFVKESVNVTGWGITGDGEGISPDLQVTNVTVMGNGQCRQVFRDVLTGNQVCTATTPTNSPCRGDSGGPLFLKQTGPKGTYLMQIGIVSFGTVTCERGFPVAFTRVTAFLDYINQVTGKSL